MSKSHFIEEDNDIDIMSRLKSYKKKKKDFSSYMNIKIIINELSDELLLKKILYEKLLLRHLQLLHR